MISWGFRAGARRWRRRCGSEREFGESGTGTGRRRSGAENHRTAQVDDTIGFARRWTRSEGLSDEETGCGSQVEREHRESRGWSRETVDKLRSCADAEQCEKM